MTLPALQKNIRQQRAVPLDKNINYLANHCLHPVKQANKTVIAILYCIRFYQRL